MARMFSQNQILPLAIAAAAGAGVLYLATRPKGPPPPPTCPPGQMWNPTLNACLPGGLVPIGPVTPTGNVGSLAQVGDDVLVPASALGLQQLGGAIPPGSGSVYLAVTSADPTNVQGTPSGYPTPGPLPTKTPLPALGLPLPPVTVPRTAIQQVLRNGVPQVPILTPMGTTPMVPPMNPPMTPPAAPSPPGTPVPRGTTDGRERGGAAIAGCGGWGPSYPWYGVPASLPTIGAVPMTPLMRHRQQQEAFRRWRRRHHHATPYAVPAPQRPITDPFSSVATSSRIRY